MAPDSNGAEAADAGVPQLDATAASAEGQQLDLPPIPPVRSIWRLRPSRVAAGAFALGLLVTAAFALISHALYDQNEGRLLRLRARELGSEVTSAVPSVQSTLASAAELADATHGNPAKFHSFIASYVGPGHQFASASLWRLGTAMPAPSAVVGAPPALASLPEQARSLFANAAHSHLLDVTGILQSGHPSLGFEFSTPGVTNGWAVYAENFLPHDRRSSLQSNSAFSDLNYALYLGRSRKPADLLVTSLHHFPISGRQASDAVPFGDSVFTVVVTPAAPLGGTFFADLPWIIVVVGVLLSVAAALMTDRLASRRQYAEQLTAVLDRVANENHQLYTEQRSIAQTLQHALLPETLPRFAGLQVSASYVPAAAEIDVGGDWYDVVACGEGVLMVLGDVSGHGLRAATTMASLRHAALAYATQDCSPGRVLTRLSEFVNSSPHDYFATVLCVLIDVNGHRLTMASAGHIPPLLIEGRRGRFVDIDTNLPIGVGAGQRYGETVLAVEPHATLIAFTDGLVERRGEVIDAGLARLRESATVQSLALGDLLAKLVHGLASNGHHDDTAIVGIRWKS